MTSVSLKTVMLSNPHLVDAPYLSLEVCANGIEIKFYNGAVVASAACTDGRMYTVYEESYNNEMDDEDYEIDYAIAEENGTLPTYISIEGIPVYINRPASM